MVYVVTIGLPLVSIAVVVLTTEVVKLSVHIVSVFSGTRAATSVILISFPAASVEL